MRLVRSAISCDHPSVSPYGWDLAKGKPVRLCEDCGFHVGRHERRPGIFVRLASGA